MPSALLGLPVLKAPEANAGNKKVHFSVLTVLVEEQRANLERSETVFNAN
jgi:hypothetical protein